MRDGLSRRQCLMLLAQAAGSSAVVFQAARAFGLTVTPEPADPAVMSPLVGRKRSVVILGAGISGLVAAYELEHAGYDVTVYEASHRIGGRNFTVRHGDVIDEVGNPQTCRFDDAPHLYFNAGPARIPAMHTGIMHYCRTLGLEMEIFSNYNKNCYTQDDAVFDGKPVRIREYDADLRGFMAELLAKSVSPDHLDQPFDAQDMERLMAFLKSHGDLDKQLRYRGSDRAGFTSGGILSKGVVPEPRPFRELLMSTFATGPMDWKDLPFPVAGAHQFAEVSDQAPSMLTPRGGMDQIVRHFVAALKSGIKTRARVQQITLTGDGVEIQYLHGGKRYSDRADYCLNSIPAHILTGIDNNFPADYRHALGTLKRGKLLKIGFQARERFWEREGIYAGISWTTQDITQLWYPQYGIFQQKGILLGAYSWDPNIVDRFATLTHRERLAKAVAEGEKLHPGYGQHLETGVSVCWHRMDNMLGCGSSWTAEGKYTGYPRLQAPAGRHYMMGDQLSLHSGWQEGAVRSAWHALADIERREREAAT